MKGIPEEALSISISSLSETSLKQYNSALRKWWTFCKDNELSIYEARTTDVIRFLTIEFEKGMLYGSLNSLRSAISLILDQDLGQSEVVKRFFRGLSNVRPPKPKYDSTWDPKIVLDYFKNLNNEKLSLESLSKKLITLLALVTGQRLQTLSLINIKNIDFKDETVEIKIPDKVKTSRLGRNQPILTLPVYKERENVCPVTALRCYLERTKDLRGDKTFLFISFKKPFKEVSTQTLGRWIKNVLRESRLDTNVFSAHSTRHASTSAAKRKGVSFDVIRKLAGWSDKSTTFTKFYYRPVAKNLEAFGHAILEK